MNLSRLMTEMSKSSYRIDQVTLAAYDQIPCHCLNFGSYDGIRRLEFALAADGSYLGKNPVPLEKCRSIVFIAQVPPNALIALPTSFDSE